MCLGRFSHEIVTNTDWIWKLILGIFLFFAAKWTVGTLMLLFYSIKDSMFSVKQKNNLHLRTLLKRSIKRLCKLGNWIAALSWLWVMWVFLMWILTYHLSTLKVVIMITFGFIDRNGVFGIRWKPLFFSLRLWNFTCNRCSL